MKSVYLGTTKEQFKESYKENLIEFYSNKTEIISEDSSVFIFQIPFQDSYYARVEYDNTSVKIGLEEDISGSNISNDFIFNKENRYTLFTLLILKNNSITLLEGDSDSARGGQSIYSIMNTDKGLVFFSCCENQSRIITCKSICLDTGKDLTPVTFGNQVLSSNNEVLKQPFRLTDGDGEIYTALDIYNISYKPEDFTALPKSFISNWGLASKDNPQEAIMTSLLIYDEEEE